MHISNPLPIFKLRKLYIITMLSHGISYYTSFCMPNFPSLPLLQFIMAEVCYYSIRSCTFKVSLSLKFLFVFVYSATPLCGDRLSALPCHLTHHSICYSHCTCCLGCCKASIIIIKAKGPSSKCSHSDVMSMSHPNRKSFATSAKAFRN